MSGEHSSEATSGRASLACPRCGCSEYTVDKQQSERKVVFMYDRVCQRCGTCYTPPTPIWARLLFVLIGILVGGAAAFLFIAKTQLGVKRHPYDLSLLAFLVLCFMSASCFWQAVKKSPSK